MHSGLQCARVETAGPPIHVLSLGETGETRVDHWLAPQPGCASDRVARGGTPSTLAYETEVDAVLDGLAAHLEVHLDIDTLIRMAR